MVSLINIYFLICENNKENILSKLSEVKLKIKENGNIKLFSDDFLRKYNHCDIYINGTFFNTKMAQEPVES